MYSIKWFSNVPYTCDMSKKKQECLKKNVPYTCTCEMSTKKNVIKIVLICMYITMRIKNSISTGSPPPLLDDLLLHIQ